MLKLKEWTVLFCGYLKESTCPVLLWGGGKRGKMREERLTPRKLQILKAIVDAHIENGDPVGSRYLSEMTELTCSPATIRNEMAELEQMGYLIQPHTSAGRIPSEMGYRLYVDALIRQYSDTRSEIDSIREQLRCKLTEMDEILAEASRIASTCSDYTGIAFKSGASSARVSRFAGVYLGPREFLLVLTFEGDIVKTKTVHVDITIDEDTVRRFTEALNLYLVNLTGSEINMPLQMRIEALMGGKGGIVHPSLKVICEAMNELDSSDLRLEGITKLLQYPEYSDMARFRGLLGPDLLVGIGYSVVDEVCELLQGDRLLARLASDTRRVVHNDGGENERHGKYTAVKALDDSRRDHERRNYRRVAAGHSAVAPKTLDVNLLRDAGIYYRLDYLCQKPGDKRDHNARISNKVDQKIHIFLPLSEAAACRRRLFFIFL